jgi:sugar phosphate isomerase/epimerase
MIRSAVTLSLVPEAKGGPFIFWGDLAGSCAKAAALGFDGIEIFPPRAEALPSPKLRPLLEQHGLKLAAVGTGAGWLAHKLQLTGPDPAVRARARSFAAAIVDAAGSLGAPAIIGSMQGRFEGAVTREQALMWLAEALEELGERAARFQVPLLLEPLNRYETNVLNRVAEMLDFAQSLRTRNVKLLCDLFHMNLEEVCIADALRQAGPRLGHVHFVDSNRHPAGGGHIDYAPIVEALHEIGFEGYVSGEALPFPDSEAAARQTIASFRKWFQPPKPLLA